MINCEFAEFLVKSDLCRTKVAAAQRQRTSINVDMIVAC